MKIRLLCISFKSVYILATQQQGNPRGERNKTNSPADPISHKGLDISTLEGRFMLFLADITNKKT